MTYKLLVLHMNGVISAALLVAVLRSAVTTTCVGVDADKDKAYRAAHAGKRVKVADYEKAVGVFAKRLVLVDQYGSKVDHPADSLLLALKDVDAPDVLANAAAGKYVVQAGKLVLNPEWTEPTIEIAAVG